MMTVTIIKERVYISKEKFIARRDNRGVLEIFGSSEEAKKSLIEKGYTEEYISKNVSFEVMLNFSKRDYIAAKSFLEMKKARIVRRSSSPLVCDTTYITEDGEFWIESESRLEAPEDDYYLNYLVKKVP